LEYINRHYEDFPGLNFMKISSADFECAQKRKRLNGMWRSFVGGSIGHNLASNNGGRGEDHGH